MEHLFKQLKKETENFCLSTSERRALRAQFDEMLQRHPLPARSTSFFFKHYLAVGTITLLLVVGTGATYAENALPGDFLYPIKIHVNEKILEATALSEAAEAKVKIVFVERRLEEASLATDEESVASLEKKVEEYTEEVARFVETASAKDQDVEAIEVALALNDVLETHEPAIKQATRKNRSASLRSLEARLAEKQEVLDKKTTEAVNNSEEIPGDEKRAKALRLAAERNLREAEKIVASIPDTDSIRMSGTELFMSAMMSANESETREATSTPELLLEEGKELLEEGRYKEAFNVFESIEDSLEVETPDEDLLDDPLPEN